jgi:hypothetical protein
MGLFWYLIDWIGWLVVTLFEIDREMRSGDGFQDDEHKRNQAKRRPSRRPRHR